MGGREGVSRYEYTCMCVRVSLGVCKYVCLLCMLYVSVFSLVFTCFGKVCVCVCVFQRLTHC